LEVQTFIHKKRGLYLRIAVKLELELKTPVLEGMGAG
jgi:hypothetical protein